MRQATRFLLIALLAPLLLAGCGGGRDDAGKQQVASSDQLVQAGLLLLNQGKQADALETFKQAAAKEPSNEVAHYNVGVVLQSQGKNVEALAAYGLALTAKPDYVPALFNSAVIYGGTNPPLAITTYRKIIALQPKAPTAYLNLGLLEAAAGQEQQARKDLAKAIEQDGTLVTSIPKDLFAKKTTTSSTPTPSPSPTS